MEHLNENIKKIKPNARDTSIKKYIQYINGIYKKLYDEKTFNNIKWLREYEKIMDLIKDDNYLSQRNKLNAIIVCLQTEEGNEEIIKKYSDLRDNFNKKYSHDIKTRTNDDLIPKKELDDIIDNVEKDIKYKKYKSKKDMTAKELAEYQLFIILKFHQKHALRCDLPTFKFLSTKEYNENLTKEERENGNYYLWDNSQLHLSSYKTSQKFGHIVINLDKELNNLFKSLIKKKKILTNTFLITKQNGKPYSKTEYSNLLIKFFKEKTGKNIGINGLRRIFLEKYKEVKKEMTEDAEKMGHSVDTQQTIYVE